ncbi:MAG TPA: hypothetical protein VF623_10930, partial [Segetibacter sp.]
MFFSLKQIIFLLLLLSVNSGVRSQSTATFTIQPDGISPQILTVKKHSKGYFLAGTTDGLYRFDGNIFTAYTFAKAIKNKAVTAIAEDKQIIWLGFKNGEIGILKNKTVELLNAEEGHPAVAITSIVADTAGIVYFATAGEGIYYYKKKRFYNVNTDDGLSDNYVYQILLNNTGIIACTDKGINTLNIKGAKKEVHFFTSANGLPDNIVRCLYPVGKKTSPDKGY